MAAGKGQNEETFKYCPTLCPYLDGKSSRWGFLQDGPSRSEDRTRISASAISWNLRLNLSEGKSSSNQQTDDDMVCLPRDFSHSLINFSIPRLSLLELIYQAMALYYRLSESELAKHYAMD